MRYQELREARTHLENAIAYLEEEYGGADRLDFGSFPDLVLLAMALRSVRLELKRPELFETDGSLRPMRIRLA